MRLLTGFSIRQSGLSVYDTATTAPYSDERIIMRSYVDGPTNEHELSNASSDIGVDVGHGTDASSNTLFLRRSQRCHHGGQQNNGYTVSMLRMPDTDALHRYVFLPLPC
jgi:hypothetical protein